MHTMTLKEFRIKVNAIDTQYDDKQVVVNLNDLLVTVTSVEYVNEYHYDSIEIKVEQ